MLSNEPVDEAVDGLWDAPLAGCAALWMRWGNGDGFRHRRVIPWGNYRPHPVDENFLPEPDTLPE